MDINHDVLMDERFKKADILIKSYKEIKKNLQYGGKEDTINKYGVSEKKFTRLLKAFNIQGGKQKTSENRKDGEPLLNLMVTMDNFSFLDDIDVV